MRYFGGLGAASIHYILQYRGWLKLGVLLNTLLIVSCSGQDSASSRSVMQSSSVSVNSARELEILGEGLALYNAQCVHCHTETGEAGGFGPAINEWPDTARALVTVIEQTMPPGDAGACDQQCSTYISAYMLAGFDVNGSVDTNLDFSEQEQPVIQLEGLDALGETAESYIYSGRNSPLRLPLRIEAEHFDNRGADTSYHDTTEEKFGEANIRSGTSVDIERSGDADGGYTIAWLESEEWLKYTFYNPSVQRIRVTWRVASPYDDIQFTWLINDSVQGKVDALSTGGWQVYSDINSDSVLLDAGWHTLTLRAEGIFNFNYFELSTSPIQPLDPQLLPAPIEQTPLHRLTNLEYTQSIRALLGVTAEPELLLPDNVEENFTRVDHLLGVDALRLEQYYRSAGQVLEVLFTDAEKKASLNLCADVLEKTPDCFERVAQDWQARFWRSDVTPESLSQAKDFMLVQWQAGLPPEESIKHWMHAMLVSAQFLYHVEAPFSGESLSPLTPQILANRIAFLMWCSPPDEALLKAILDNTPIAEQIDRMLLDPRSNCLAEGLVTQWLHLNSVVEKSIALSAIQPENWQPEFADKMVDETKNFMMYLLRENRPVSEILSADYTLVGEDLANFYNLDYTGPAIQKVSLTGSARQGLLTQGAVLLVTGSERGTSFIKRGIYTLSHLLCDAPPAPPPNIDQNADTESDACLGCHKFINPIGIGLQKFDSYGVYRPYDENGVDIFSVGQFYNGPSFDSAIAMSDILKSDNRMARCTTETLFRYAHRRAPTINDAKYIDNIVVQWQLQNLGLKDLITLIVTSPSFTHSAASTLTNELGGE